MTCSKCGTENSSNVKFCSECGTPIGSPCIGCGYINPRNASVCGGCGRALAVAAERRHITVFFADIAGSTTLAEHLDPEELRELYAQYQALCADVVRRYEGHIAQYLGDGILAYFGYPTAHEDDAQRAVRSGLEMLQRLDSISVGGTRPKVRIGVHTGLVVIGDVGTDLRREQLALGEAPNIAARLQSEAAPNNLIISGATAQLVTGQFALEDLGERTLKGITRPTQLFRVLGETRASRFQAMTSAAGLTPFVGRDREVGIIRELWSEAEAHRGRTLLLRGEAGIGKSRLLAAARQEAAKCPHELFEAECSPYETHSPLNPVGALLERRIGIEKGQPAADKLDLIEQFAAGRGVRLEDAAAAIAGLLGVPTGDRYSQTEMSPAKRLQWTIEVLAQILLRPAGGLPVLLLIEDLHWADPSTLDLVGEIVARQSEFAVLVVATTRPELEVGWSSHATCREIRVEALPREDARVLVARVVGRKPLPIGLMEELVARTGGIPLFVEAVTRTVIDAGILRDMGDRYELAGPLPAGLIPNTVQASLMGRIDRLGADRAVAQLAATIGREFSFELLQGVLGQPEAVLSKSLRRLVDLDLVSENGVPPYSTYMFKHALIQDAAYESLLRKTRQEFHGKIAEVLIGRLPEMAETKPELLARHYEGAGRIEEATAGWMKAGVQASNRSALRESVAYLRKAIALLETLPEEDPKRLKSEMEAQLALAPSLMSSLGWGSPEAEAACLRARDLCARLNNPQGLLGSLWGLWTVYLLRGTHVSALETAQSVLEMAQATEDPILHVIARQAIGYSTYFLGDFAAAREHAGKGLALYNPALERALMGIFQIPASFACGNFQTMSLWFLGYPEQAEAARQNAWSIIEDLAIPPCTAYGLGCALMIHYTRRDVPMVARYAKEAYRISREDGYLIWAAHGRIYRGWAQAMEGEADAGIAEINAGLEDYRLTGSELMLPQMCLMLAEALWLAKRPGEALAALSRGIKLATEHKEHVHEPELHRLKGEIQFAQGAAAAGEASIRTALAIAQEQKARMLELRAALSLAKLLRQSGRGAEGRVLLRTIYDWFSEGWDSPELREATSLLSEQ